MSKDQIMVGPARCVHGDMVLIEDFCVWVCEACGRRANVKFVFQQDSAEHAKALCDMQRKRESDRRSTRLDRAILVFVDEGPNGDPNSSDREQALARLLDGLESYGRARGKGADDAKWERVRGYVKEYLEASADAVKELREAWEETRGGA